MKQFALQLKKLTQQNSIALFFAVMCVVIATYRIGYFDLWRDEAFSVNVAKKSISEITQITSQDVHPPLHLFLLHYWMQLFGDSETSVRMLSVLFYGLAVFFVYESASLLFKEQRFRVLATVFTATTPLVIYHAIEVRSYSMLIAATAALIYFFLRIILQKVTKFDYVELAITILIGLYTHTMFLFVLFSASLWLALSLLSRYDFSLTRFFKEKELKKLHTLIAVYVLIAVLFSPWLFHLYQQVTRVNTEGFWLQFEPMKYLVDSFDLFFTSDRYALDLQPVIRLIVYVLSTFGAVITVIGMFSRKKGTENFLGVLLFLFLATVFITSFKTPIYFLRYLVFILPVVAILFTHGIQALEGVIGKRVMIIFCVIFILAQSYLYFGNILQNENLKERYSHAVRELAFNEETDVILHPHGYTLHSFLYYSDNPGYLYDPEKKLPHYEGTAAFSDENYFTGNLDTYSRVWVPYLWNDQNFEQVLLEHGFQITRHQEFSGGVKLDLWRKI